MKERLLFIDTETGGLDSSKHSLLSIALVVWADKKIVNSLELFINDGVLSVTQEALSINKIDIEKHILKAISPAKAIEKIIQFVSTHFPQQKKITIAGHNVQFDLGFMKVLFLQKMEEFNRLFSHRIIDTSSILHYLYLAGHIKQKAISSDEAFDFFKIKVKGRHTALGDAIATAELFTKLLYFTN